MSKIFIFIESMDIIHTYIAVLRIIDKMLPHKVLYYNKYGDASKYDEKNI